MTDFYVYVYFKLFQENRTRLVQKSLDSVPSHVTVLACSGAGCSVGDIAG